MIPGELVQFRLAGMCGLQPLGEPRVQARPPPFGDQLVGGIADEDVSEPERITSWQGRRCRADQLAAHKFVQRGVGLDQRGLGEKRAHSRAVKRAAFHGGGFDYPARLIRKCVHACAEQRLNRRRDRCGGIVRAHRDQLLNEQRVPLRRGKNLSSLAADGSRAGKAVDQPSRVGLTEWAQTDVRGAPEPRAPSGSYVEQFVACNGDDQDWSGRRVVVQVLDEIEHCRLRPVHVVEHHDRWAQACERFDQRPRRPLHVLWCCRLARPPKRAFEDRRGARSTRVSRHHSFKRVEAAEAVGDLLQRPVGDSLAVGEAASDDARRRRIERGGKGPRQVRLPYAGCARDYRDDASFLIRCLIKVMGEASELTAASCDRLERWGTRRRCHTENAPRGERLRLAAEAELTMRRRFDDVCDQLVRRRPDQHRA